MPLPTQGMAWPPAALAPVTPKLEEWSAWWTGNPDQLTKAYLGRDGRTMRPRPSQLQGGVVGAVSRFWWGRPQVDLSQQRDQVHVPLPADIARTSADLLFSEPPEIVFTNTTTQEWLEADLEDGIFDVLTGAAERCAATGGVYLRVTWDRQVRDRVFLTPVPAEGAWPEFSWGVLRAVTFWTVVGTEGQTVWRHLERHELAPNGDGLVQHGLYEGGPDQLGRAVPLTEHAETRALAQVIDAEGYVADGRTPGLNVVYIPNTGRTTAKAWAKVPGARYLGGSDFDGVEGLFDNLDEIHAAWLRDIRLAKARLVVARYMLDDHGAGAGASFNLDQEVFAPLKMAVGEDRESPITPVQFAIRFEEHRATAEEWSNRIVRSAGYSVQTFGGSDEGSQMTATEVASRDSRSMMTRGRKIRAWRPALREILSKMVTVQASVFGGAGLVPELERLSFPDGIWETPLQAAQTAQALSVAGAASTRTLVALAHPEWDEKAVDAEAERILAERGTPVADPFAIGG